MGHAPRTLGVLTVLCLLIAGLQALEAHHGAAGGVQHAVGRDCGGFWA